ncbi:hypothetical protein N2152v2_002733 [Parachlorella kessleri]
MTEVLGMVGNLEAGLDAGVIPDVAEARLPLQLDTTVGDQPSNGNLEGGVAQQGGGQAAPHHKPRQQRHYRSHGLGSEGSKEEEAEVKEQREVMGQLPSAARVAGSGHGSEAAAGTTPRVDSALVLPAKEAAAAVLQEEQRSGSPSKPSRHSVSPSRQRSLAQRRQRSRSRSRSRDRERRLRHQQQQQGGVHSRSGDRSEQGDSPRRHRSRSPRRRGNSSSSRHRAHDRGGGRSGSRERAQRHGSRGRRSGSPAAASVAAADEDCRDGTRDGGQPQRRRSSSRDRGRSGSRSRERARDRSRRRRSKERSRSRDRRQHRSRSRSPRRRHEERSQSRGRQHTSSPRTWEGHRRSRSHDHRDSSTPRKGAGSLKRGRSSSPPPRRAAAALDAARAAKPAMRPQSAGSAGAMAAQQATAADGSHSGAPGGSSAPRLQDKHGLLDGHIARGTDGQPGSAAVAAGVAGSHSPASDSRPSMVVRLKIRPGVSPGGGPSPSQGPAPVKPSGEASPASVPSTMAVQQQQFPGAEAPRSPRGQLQGRATGGPALLPGEKQQQQGVGAGKGLTHVRVVTAATEAAAAAGAGVEAAILGVLRSHEAIPAGQQQGQQLQQQGASGAAAEGAKRALSPRAAAQHAQQAKQLKGAAMPGPGSGQATPRAGAVGALRQRLSFGDEIDLDSVEDGPTVRERAIQGLAAATARRFLKERELVVLHPALQEAPTALTLAEDSAAQHGPAGKASEGPKTLGPVHFGVALAKGMRPYMEDRHTVVASLFPLSSTGVPIQDGVARCFAAVYDGHNGALAAEHAADRLHTLLASETALRTCTGDGPPSTQRQEAERMCAALRHAFEATDREILVRCRLEGNKSGATGVAVVRVGELLYAAHAGDSRAVLCRAGTALRLTEDHKPNLPRERERVEGAGGRVDFARCWRVIVDPGGGRPASGLAVSRSFGDPDFKEPLHLVTATPDVAQHRLQPGDSFIVLASDGLWDVLTDGEACEVVSRHLRQHVHVAPAGAPALPGRSGAPALDPRLATSAAEALVHTALSRGTMDNVTAVVALLQWD